MVVVEEEAGVLTEAPIRVAYSPLYWTAHCEGFIVDTHEGRFGIVVASARRTFWLAEAGVLATRATIPGGSASPEPPADAEASSS